MSFQAVTWAIEQRAGGPSAKAVLWSIANYADEHWCSYPSQARISAESEQSVDSVQRRLPDLEDAGLVRRIPLRFAGRKSVDFFILQPSRFFRSPLSEIEPLLPRGFVVDLKGVSETPPPEKATAICGSALPQVAVDATANATALLRQHEPLNLRHGGDGSSEAPAPFSPEAFKLADDLAVIAGHEPAFLPVRWVSEGPVRVAQDMIDAGWSIQMMIETAAAVVRNKRDGPPATLRYFMRPFARAHALQSESQPLPTFEKSDVQSTGPNHSGRKSGQSLASIAVARARSAGCS